MHKAVARAVLVTAVSAALAVPAAGAAQAATAAPVAAGQGTAVSQAHPCDWNPWHPACHGWHHHDEGLINVDVI